MPSLIANYVPPTPSLPLSLSLSVCVFVVIVTVTDASVLLQRLGLLSFLQKATNALHSLRQQQPLKQSPLPHRVPFVALVLLGELMAHPWIDHSRPVYPGTVKEGYLVKSPPLGRKGVKVCCAARSSKQT